LIIFVAQYVCFDGFAGTFMLSVQFATFVNKTAVRAMIAEIFVNAIVTLFEVVKGYIFIADGSSVEFT